MSTEPESPKSSPEQPVPPPTPNHSEEKALLECEKIRAEIASIRKPLYATPGFYSAIAPVALAILGLIFTWSTGWFDVQRTRINNEKTLVEAQTVTLKWERSTLEAQAKEQQRRIAQSETEIEKLRQRESSLTNQVGNLSRERDELRVAKEFLENETKRLAGSDAKAIDFLTQLKSIQRDRDKVISNLQIEQTSNATLRSQINLQVALIQWAHEVLLDGTKRALIDKSTWEKFRPFVSDAQRVIVGCMPFLPEWQIPDRLEAERYDESYQAAFMGWIGLNVGKPLNDYVDRPRDRYERLRVVYLKGTNQSLKIGVP